MAPTDDTTATAPFTGIQRVQRTQLVRQQLEQAIARGDYGPGDKLPSERELVALFGVSRITVREAIRSLEAVGLVSVQHGRGCFVGPLVDDTLPSGEWLSVHHKALIDLLRVRAALDTLAAERAAARRDPDELAAIRAAHEAFAAAADDAGATPDRLAELDIDFHRAIAVASGNTLLRHLLDDLGRYLGESRRALLAPRGRPHASAGEHARLLAAIEAGDATAARRAVHRHSDAVIAVLRRIDEARD